MGTQAIHIDVNLLAAFGETPEERESAVNELLTLEAYRRHEITGSQAARLLGMSLAQFMTHASERGIPVISLPEDELADDVRSLEAFLGRSGRR